ncbi:N-terminal domain of NEFA-interacting nuclear protein NIP30-domain-containing protein [Apiospora arundinis]
MSSRFVSGGTLPGDTPATTTTPTEATSNPATSATAPKAQQPQQPVLSSTTTTTTTTTTSSNANANTKPATNNKNAAEWARVQAELDAQRAQREATRRANGEGTEEKSLFEVLQANKAAKQAAFEEASRLRNQFRALDDDEVDFLDEVQEKERQEEERKRRELEEGLGKFRQAQLKGKPTANGEDGVVEEEEVVPTEDLASEWAAAGAGGAGRKRKREKEALFKGLKRKSTSEGAAQAKDTTTTKTADANGAAKATEQTTKPPVTAAKPAAATKPAMGLVAYGSDDDDDDD